MNYLKECSVRKIGSDMIELHFKTREIEYVKQNGAFSCVVKFRSRPRPDIESEEETAARIEKSKQK